jgi:hypothetical protein
LDQTWDDWLRALDGLFLFAMLRGRTVGKLHVAFDLTLA